MPTDDQLLDAAQSIWRALNSAPWTAYPDMHDRYLDAARAAWRAFHPEE